MKRWVNPEIVLGIALGIVLCLFVAVVLSDQIEHCGQINPQTAQTPSDKPQVPSATQTHKGGSDEKTEYDKSHPIACGVLGFVPSAIHYMDRNEGFFLGAFTLALFLATSFLWRSTEKLWEAGERQISLAKATAAVQAADTQATLRIAEASAKAAERSANTAELALVETDRAFVYFETPSIEAPEPPFTSDKKFIFHFTWKNSGSTRTIEGQGHASWQSFPAPLEESFTFPDLGARPGPIFVAPGGVTHMGPIDVPHDYVQRALDGETYLFFWGWVEYDDVFKGTPRHRSEFCLRLVLIDRRESVPSGQRGIVGLLNNHIHNGAEDECFKDVQTGSTKNPLPRPG